LGLLLQIALHFVEESEELSPADVLLTKGWSDIAAKKVVEKKVQTKISDVFRRNL
jgi:hypothetical protein